MGFEPTRGDPIGLAGRRLSRSAKVSLGDVWVAFYIVAFPFIVNQCMPAQLCGWCGQQMVGIGIRTLYVQDCGRSQYP